VSALGSLNAALTAEGDAYIWGMPFYSAEIVLMKIEGKLLLQVGPLNEMTVASVGLSLSDDESFSDLVGFPLDKLAQLVAEKILAHTNNYGLATKPDLLSAVQQAAADGEQQGIASVQSQPNSFGLYDSTQYEANRITGVAEGKAQVTNNPTAYSLFTESSIMDMNMGGLMLKNGTNASELDLELTIETKDSLLDNEWQVAERIARKVSMDGAQRQFLRVRAGAPYVAPNVKVLAHPTLGNILTDGAGRVIYFFAADSPGGNPLFSGPSWPYVTVPEAPKADAGVSATLASSTFGRPGGPYLTVNGRPAYYYVGDAAAGQANGHGLGYVWWTIRADGVFNQ
jgi:predicted lipoprotein with Yx(FWY)xxD motif